MDQHWNSWEQSRMIDSDKNVLQENGIWVQLSIECIPSKELISQNLSKMVVDICYNNGDNFSFWVLIVFLIFLAICLCLTAVTISSTVIVIAQFQEICFLNFFNRRDILTNLVVNVLKIQIFFFLGLMLKKSVKLYQFFLAETFVTATFRRLFVSLTPPLQPLFLKRRQTWKSERRFAIFKRLKQQQDISLLDCSQHKGKSWICFWIGFQICC